MMKHTALRHIMVLAMTLVATVMLAACAGAQPTPAAKGGDSGAGKSAGGPTGTGGTAAQAGPDLQGKDDIQVVTGSHTIYHSKAPLPSATSPRADGRYTLVWFSATY